MLEQLPILISLITLLLLLSSCSWKAPIVYDDGHYKYGYVSMEELEVPPIHVLSTFKDSGGKIIKKKHTISVTCDMEIK